jgi:glycosyltransferase involved in cell wall biosynthesis
MKVVLDCFHPVALAHGGAQIQIDQTQAGLAAIGVEVEYLRWWDKDQKSDLIHFFGTASQSYLGLARQAGKPVVMTTLFSETCNRSDARLRRQGWLIQTALKIPVARQVKNQLNWSTYNHATHNLVGLECEKFVLRTVYRVPEERISVVPLGVPDAFLRAGQGQHHEPHLITTGTICPVKNSVELARMARAAEIPILFVGKPYSTGDAYWRRFQELIDGRWVKYQPHVESQAEVISLLQSARGFVLMSNYENWSLAAHEAVACGLPLLVQDQKWSRERFGHQAHYFDRVGFSPRNVEILKQFHAAAPTLPAPAIPLPSWREVAAQLKQVYERVLTRTKT